MRERKRSLENTDPLSYSQENIWALEQSFPGTPMNNICATMRIRGRLDIALIQKSLHLVIQSDPSLRTQLTLVDGSPRQYQAEHEEAPSPFFDFTMTNQNGFRQWEAAVTRDQMPLLDSPLYFFAIFKLGENDGGVIIKTHHLISDGWSQVLIGNRFSELYLKFLAAEPGQYATITAEPAPSYHGHLDAEQKYLRSSAYQRDLAYWDDALKNRPEPAALKDCISPSVSPVGQRKTYALNELLNHAIYRFCSTYRVAPFSVIYMALAIYLNRINGLDRICIGVPIFNRSNYLEKLTTGMFVSTLPFLCSVDENWSFAEFNQHLTEQWYSLLKHQRFPFSQMAEIVKKHTPDQPKLFHIVLSYQNSKMNASDNASVSFSGEWHYSGYQAEHLCIHLSHLEDEHRYSISYDYLSQIFSEQEIDSLHGYLVNILSEALEYPDRPLWQYAVMNDREKEQVLFSFNRTDVPRYQTSLCSQWDSVLKRNAARVALIQNGERMTYETLSKRGDRYASLLLKRFPEQTITAALLLPKSFDLFEAMVGLMQSGNAWIILPDDIPPGRLQEILSDSGARVVITTQELRQAYSLPEDLCLTAEDCALSPLPSQPVRRAGMFKDLAYIVYTSGSTGKPKGVEIGQDNLLNFALSMGGYYGHGGVLSLCSTGFDVFMLESAAALLNGRTIVLPTPEEVESPAKLARLIREYAVGFFALTPSRLTAFLRNGEFLLALSKLDAIVCGGEAFPGDLLQMLKLYTHADIYNQYGPSEATVGVSIKRLNDASCITIGAPMENCRMYLLDKHLSPLPVGAYGDLYIGGACVGKGYRNLPERTAQSFLDSPFELGERIYKTGDVGRWTPDGEIVLGGRKDQQIKLRGLRIEPQEIAARIAMYPDVDKAAVRLIEQNSHTVIAGYYTSPQPLDELHLLEFCANFLPSYMIPACLIRVDHIPLTENGKADLDLLPLPVQPSLAQTAQTGMQNTIVALFKKVLKRDDIGVLSDYFLSGGDSLNALETLSELEHAFGVTLRVADLYACRTAARLEQRIRECKGMPAAAAAPVLPKAPLRDSYPLTPIQQNLYVQSKLDPTGLSYNMPGAFRLPESIDLERLKASLSRLVETEPLLRARFVSEGPRVVQKIDPNVPFQVEQIDAPDFSQACRQFVRPFDISRAPLFRAGLWREDAEHCVLLIDLHHIICDGISSPLLLKRLDALYSKEHEDVEAEALTYLDYACYWEQNSKQTDPDTADYWKRVLSIEGEPMALPTDNARPRRFDYLGQKQEFCLTAELSAACDAFCDAHGISAYMLFAGVFGILLSKVSGSFDFLIGTPVSGRNRQEFWNLFGAFINTLPLRLSPGRERTVSEYLQAVKDQVVNMLDHQEITPDQLITLTGTQRSLDKNALYSVMFSMRPISAEEFALGGALLPFLPVQTGTAKLDLNLEAAKEAGCYAFSLEYASSLFEPDTIALYCRSFQKLLEEVLDGAETPLYDLSPLASVDKRMLIDIPNHTVTPYLNLPIDRLIDENAEADPSRPAVTFHGETISYGEFKKRSDALAGLLQELGVVRGDAVAFCLKRGTDIPVAMAAINKAGAAYIPMVDSLPANRLRSMLETAGAKLVLCDLQTQSKLSDLSCPVQAISYDHSPLSPVIGRSGEDIMHILYTSGSTGKPKGVAIKHSNLCNLLPRIEEMLRGIDGSFLCIANAIFDTFITETLYQLALGRTVIMADEEEMMLPWKMAELIGRHKATMLQFTPSRLQMCLNSKPFCQALRNIQLIIVCGEVFQPSLLKQLQSRTDAKIITMYGPTEVTVYMTMADVTHADHISIGKPMNNCRVYVLDENLRPVMPTAVGELYIAGECVSAGYVGRPDLTKERYLPDPLFPGQKMYRSGDLGRLRTDGYYDFAGRRDNQIKLNGQRIELDEITGQLLSCPGVQEAAVVAVKKEDSSMALRGFLVCGQDGSLEEIKRSLAENLPPYMIPSQLTLLDELPKTPTGKTDLQRLSRWQDEKRPAGTARSAVECSAFTAPAKDEVSPRPDTAGQTAPQTALPDSVPALDENSEACKTPALSLAEQLGELWRAVLERQEVDSARSFFEQGGTSLAALNLLSLYFNQGFSMTLEQFYDHPTLAEQAELLGKASSLALAEEAGAPKLVSSAPDETSGETCGKTVLLTGATGFLGSHLVRALLEKGVSRVICPVRGEHPERLYDSLQGYFGKDWVGVHRDAVLAVSGDIQKPSLGLALSELPPVDELLHAAADVRHYTVGGSSIQTNTSGTANAIQAAKALEARFHHISTISVCGEYLTEAPDKRCIFTENDRDIGQNWRENSYVQGKFLSEHLVFEAAKQGLPAKIFRIGRLVGRQSDGVFQKNPGQNTFYSLMRGIMLLDLYPASLEHLPIELSAVDECARAISLLMDGEQIVYHVFNPSAVELGTLARQFNRAICPADDQEFEHHLSERMSRGYSSHLSVLLDLWNRVKLHPATIIPSAVRTVSELQTRSFQWPQPDPALLLQSFVQ